MKKVGRNKKERKIGDRWDRLDERRSVWFSKVLFRSLLNNGKYTEVGDQKFYLKKTKKKRKNYTSQQSRFGTSIFASLGVSGAPIHHLSMFLILVLLWSTKGQY